MGLNVTNALRLSAAKKFSDGQVYNLTVAEIEVLQEDGYTINNIHLLLSAKELYKQNKSHVYFSGTFEKKNIFITSIKVFTPRQKKQEVFSTPEFLSGIQTLADDVKPKVMAVIFTF